MKLRDIRKAQARYDEISEKIKELRIIREKLYKLTLETEDGHEFIEKCIDWVMCRIDALRKEREEIEV